MRQVLQILGQFDDRDIDWMIQAGKREQLAPKTVIIQHGKPVSSLYIILDGTCRVVSATGREIARLSCGEIAGELSFLDSRPPSATVEAATNALVLSIPCAKVQARLKENLAFSARFYRALGTLIASRLRAMVLRVDAKAGDTSAESEDEIDPDILDQVSLAGARFEVMLKRLRGA